MIRVLCVFGRLNRGGAETMCMNLYRQIDRSKVQFDFVKHTEDECQFDAEIKSLGGRIYVAPRYSVKNYTEYVKWWEKHFENHPEHLIVHGHMFTISPIFFKVAHRYGRVTVAHSHSTKPKREKLSLKILYKWFLRKRVSAHADYRLACSAEAGVFLYGKKPFYVLNNALEAKKYAYEETLQKAKRKELGIEPESRVICEVASFTSPKNPMGCLDLFKQIHLKNPETRLLWVGDGPMRAAFEERVRNEHLDGMVQTLGVRSDVHEILQAADVFFLPSLYEGLPISLVEAQASGLLCLVSDNVPRESDVTGLCRFLSIDDPEKWVEAYSELKSFNRRDMREVIKSAGYDIEATSKWLQDFYIEIAQ